MFCHECGKENPDYALFCTNCGTPLEKKDENDTVTLSPNAEEAIGAASAEVVVLPAKSTQKTITTACIVVILMVLLAVGGLFAWKFFTKKELPLDENTIKDAALRSTLTVKYDLDQDGKLSEEELNNVNEIEVTEGSDLSWIGYFPNLREGVIEDDEVDKLDLSKNTNLVAIDLSKCTYLKELILPNIESYDEYKLPNNEDLVVRFDGNSDFEAKWVPTKVSQGYVNVSGQNDTVKYNTLEQEVVSAYQIRSFTIDGETSSFETNFSYDENGRLVESKFQSDSRTEWRRLYYDSENKINSETYKVQSNPNYDSGDYSVSYASDGTVSEAFKKEVNSDESGTLRVDPFAEWTFDNGTTSSYFERYGRNNQYLRRMFEFSGNKVCSGETFQTFSVSGSSLDSDRALDSRVSSVNYTYENGKLVKAEFDNGFTLNYKYDQAENLVEVSSSGDPGVIGLSVTKNCKIEYARVICKKDQEPLSYISLAGVGNNGLVNFMCKPRFMTSCLSGTFDYKFTTVDFDGHFWWDENNVVSNQVAAKEAKRKLYERVEGEVAKSDGDSEAKITSARDAQIKSYRDKGYLVYEGVSRFHAKATDSPDGKSGEDFYYIDLNEAQEVPCNRSPYTSGTVYPTLTQIADAGDETTEGKEVLVVVKQYISFRATARCAGGCGGTEFMHCLGLDNFVVIAET